MNRDCVFCKIAGGLISADVVYQDDKIMAFLDVAPINPGHLLVIPKHHYISSASFPEEIAGKIFYIGSRLGIACRRVLDADGYNLHLSDGACAGQEIEHTHLHVVPRFIDDGFFWNWRKLQKDDKAFSELAIKIKNRLKTTEKDSYDN